VSLAQNHHPRLTRRALLSGVTATAAPTLLTACGGASGDTPTAATKAPTTSGATAHATTATLTGAASAVSPAQGNRKNQAVRTLRR